MRFEVEFDGTPYEDGTVGAAVDRLNWRAERLLTQNRSLVEGKRLLDIASNDGRLSYAALKLGAAHVTGIEGREHQVERANRNMAALGIEAGRYRFETGDIFDHLPRFEPGSFDTICCFGFFYHTLRQVEMMQQFARLRPAAVIMDSTVSRERRLLRLLRFGWRFRPRHLSPSGIRRLWDSIEGDERLVLKSEDAGKDANTIVAAGTARREDELAYRQMAFKFEPTASLIERLFEIYGFSCETVNWHDGRISDWHAIDDYRVLKRVTIVARPV